MAEQQCRVCRQVLPAAAFKEKHNGTRTLTCRACLAKHRPYQQPYQQTYRHTHHDHIAESKRQYREQHRDETAAYQRHYYLTNKARLAARKHEYHQKNREKELARKRRSYHEQHACKRDANAVASPGKGGSSNRKKADSVNQQGR
jgi:hypothetical protein